MTGENANHKLHLDTNIGGDIDDLCALAMVLEWPDVELLSITTVAEHRGKRAGYARYALELAGRKDIANNRGMYNRGGGETVDDISNVRMDKTGFSVVSLSDESDEREYWWRKPPHERLAVVELLGQMNYDYDPATARLQRVLEITQREGG